MASQSPPQQNRSFGTFRNQHSDEDLSEHSDLQGYHVSDSYESPVKPKHTFPPAAPSKQVLQGVHSASQESEGESMAEERKSTSALGS